MPVHSFPPACTQYMADAARAPFGAPTFIVEWVVILIADSVQSRVDTETTASQGTENELPPQTVCNHHTLLYIKFLIIEGAAIVHLTQMDLVKAQRDLTVLLELCTAHPALLGKPLLSSLYMLIGQPTSMPVLLCATNNVHQLCYIAGTPCHAWCSLHVLTGALYVMCIVSCGIGPCHAGGLDSPAVKRSIMGI